jgi:hypothetical protein
VIAQRIDEGAQLNQNLNQGSFSKLNQYFRRDGAIDPDIPGFHFCSLVVYGPAQRRELS